MDLTVELGSAVKMLLLCSLLVLEGIFSAKSGKCSCGALKASGREAERLWNFEPFLKVTTISF